MKRFVAAVGLLVVLASLGLMLPGYTVDLGCNGPRPEPWHPDRDRDRDRDHHHFRAEPPKADPK